MENRCGLCGCKTDLIDLTEYEFKNGTKTSVCRFCEKQLSAFNKNPKANAMWAQQLLQTDTNGVRQKIAEEALKQIMLENQIEVLAPQINENTCVMPQSYNTQAVQNMSAVKLQQTAASAFSNQPLTETEELQMVKKQLFDLQKEFKKFKQRYYLSKILGIVLPIIIVLLLFIILFSSGAFQNIFDYYAQLSDWANY